MDAIQKSMLEKIADLHEVPEGAYNIRSNGALAGRNTTANIDIVTKQDKPGIDIIIKPGTKNESVHIPVILSESGLNDCVYNDFYIGEGADVVIVAGCGIHNCGTDTSEHDGIHTFFIGKNAKVKYIEKHYGEGDGTGEKILNPTTIVHIDDWHNSGGVLNSVTDCSATTSRQANGRNTNVTKALMQVPFSQSSDNATAGYGSPPHWDCVIMTRVPTASNGSGTMSSGKYSYTQ